MALATMSTTKKLGRGQLYLAAYPTTQPGTAQNYGTIAAAYIALKTSAYMNLDSKGLELTIKPNVSSFDGNINAKEPVGYTDFDISFDFTGSDFDAAHLKDLMNSLATQQITTTASTGIPAYSGVAMGAQVYLNNVSLIYAIPSLKFAGSFDHLIIPKGVVYLDGKITMASKDVLTLSAKGSALNDPWWQNPTTLQYEQLYWCEATSVPS